MQGDIELAQTIKPPMSMDDQVRNYKYIFNADGNCAVLRLRQLLASDSAVLYVESDEVEWFHPLLVPFVHYIPVRYDSRHAENPLPDLKDRIAWAEANPQMVAEIIIVHNANHFAKSHLSEHAISCYSMQLLNEYASLFNDSHSLRDATVIEQFKIKLDPL